MSAAAEFLASVAQAMSSMSLYGVGHPTRARAVDGCLARLRALQHERGGEQRFSFARGEVLHDTVPIPGMRHWQWAARLAAAGVHRLDVGTEVGTAELEELLGHLLARIYGRAGGAGVDVVAADDAGHIRIGGAGEPATGAQGDGGRPFDDLDAEVEATRALLARVAHAGTVAGAEAQAVARALAAVRARAGGRAVPLVRLPEFDDYLVMHSLNTASLALAVAGALRLGRAGAHAACVGGLLHDVGMTRVPPHVTAGSTLDAEGRATMEDHVRVGARLILESAPELESAAVVAYEHHLQPDGGGYPRLARSRAPHLLAGVVRVCSVFSAVTSSRFHWPAWPTELSVRFLEQGAGREFDADAVAALAALARTPGAFVGVGPAAEAAAAG